MDRIWQISEQVVDDPVTNLRIEFTSVHTEEVEQGQEPPLHDEELIMRVWTTDRTRVATFLFNRNAGWKRAQIEPVTFVDPASRAAIRNADKGPPVEVQKDGSCNPVEEPPDLHEDCGHADIHQHQCDPHPVRDGRPSWLEDARPASDDGGGGGVDRPPVVE